MIGDISPAACLCVVYTIYVLVISLNLQIKFLGGRFNMVGESISDLQCISSTRLTVHQTPVSFSITRTHKNRALNYSMSFVYGFTYAFMKVDTMHINLKMYVD